MIIEKYLDRLKDNRGYSENTIKNYHRTMELFSNYIKQKSWNKRNINDAKKIKIDTIESFIKSQRDNNKDVRTCNNYLACIKLFLRFCLIKGIKTENFNRVVFAREPRKKIDALEPGDTEKMFNYLRSLDPKTKYGDIIKFRNLVILQLLLYTGVRVSELINIKVEDVAEEMQIVGKGNKPRLINLYDDDLRLIKLYMFMRRNIEGEYLLISLSGNSKGKRLSAVSVEKTIRDIWKAAGIKGKVFPHKLRHTFATNLLRANANIYHIQQLLGHNNIATTQTYLTVLNSELRDTQKLLHQKL